MNEKKPVSLVCITAEISASLIVLLPTKRMLRTVTCAPSWMSKMTSTSFDGSTRMRNSTRARK